MTEEWHKLGKLAFTDTGAVPGSTDYTTVVFIHGFAWHGGNFQRLNPYARKHNVRIVSINRRDYPGAEPYTDEERAQLESAGGSPQGRDILLDYMADRARELHQFLVEFITSEDIPPVNGNKGGIVLVAWSFGGTWLTAWLANLSKMTTNDVELGKYIRRTVLYDSPYHSLGLPHPPEKYHPLEDEAIPPAERAGVFAAWVSGYYTHGDSPDTLERRTPATDPKPTIFQIKPEEVQSSLYEGPGSPGGSDLTLLGLGIATELWAALKDRAFYLADRASDEESTGEDLAGVELRYLWCDRSVYEMPWGTWMLRTELDEAKAKGRRMRNINVVRLAGANHFAHWDFPDRVLNALLVEESEAVNM